MASPQSRPSAATVLVVLLLLGGALVLIGTAIRHLWAPGRALLQPEGHTTVSQGVVVEQTRAVAKLVSSETTVRDVVVYQNRLLGSTKRSLVVVTGKVLAGIDLDQGSEVNIDNASKQIEIVLPPAHVIAVEVTQLRTYNEQSGLWNPFRPEDRDTIYDLARAQLVTASGELGLTAHAEDSARRLLTALIHPEGYTVTVKFARLKSRPGRDTSSIRRQEISTPAR
jgi:Protein of unknown function (DUF4230)